jgi:hypothetical protein
MHDAFEACLRLRFRWIDTIVLRTIPGCEVDAGVVAAEVYAMVNQLALSEAFCVAPRYGKRVPPLIEAIPGLAEAYRRFYKAHASTIASREFHESPAQSQVEVSEHPSLRLIPGGQYAVRSPGHAVRLPAAR